MNTGDIVEVTRVKGRAMHLRIADDPTAPITKVWAKGQEWSTYAVGTRLAVSVDEDNPHAFSLKPVSWPDGTPIVIPPVID